MLKMFYRALNNDKGFTLIELIVVIAVLGILAAVALPRISGISSDAKTNADAANLKMLQNAAEYYNAKEGSFPANKNDFDSYVDEYPTQQSANVGSHWYFDTDNNVVVATSPTNGFEIVD